jgi:pimeloyl-ACP methyl ester carboxylesterase
MIRRPLSALWSEFRGRSFLRVTPTQGAVIAATRNDKVKALVYVAALAPDQGETVAEVFYRTKPHPLAPKLTPDKHGLIYLPEEAFAAAFAQNASVDELALLSAVQRPISPACITVPVTRPLWKDRPTWFLMAEQDRMIVHDTQRFMAERMHARVRSHPVDHAPIVTAPGLVIDIIGQAIGEASSG